jgi:hypothetical protein
MINLQQDCSALAQDLASSSSLYQKHQNYRTLLVTLQLLFITIMSIISPPYMTTISAAANFIGYFFSSDGEGLYSLLVITESGLLTFAFVIHICLQNSTWSTWSPTGASWPSDNVIRLTRPSLTTSQLFALITPAMNAEQNFIESW